MALPDILFYVFALLTVSLCGLFPSEGRAKNEIQSEANRCRGVAANPVTSAMFSRADLSFHGRAVRALHAFFLAAVQISSIAGAVMVLFLFVIKKCCWVF